MNLSSFAVRYRRFGGAAILAASLASLFLPAEQYGAGYEFSELHWNSGWDMFLIGPMGPFVGEFAWYANPILIFATARLLWGRPVGLLAGFATFLLAGSAVRNIGKIGCVGGCGKTLALGSGYYLWLAAAGLLAMLAVSDAITAKKAALQNL